MVTKKDMLRKLKVTQLRELAKSSDMEIKGKKEDIVGELSNRMKKEEVFEHISRLTLTKPDFEIFSHDFVPVHDILTEEELATLLSKYNCKKGSLPKIKYTDAAVKYLGAKPGDVVRAKRKSITAGMFEYYRLVTR